MSSFANVLDLRSVPVEPWGARLMRARRTADLTLNAVARLLRPHLSASTLNRLELLDVPPTTLKDRGRAVMVLVLYGVDPSEFGLELADIPPAVDLRAVRDLGESVTAG